jgi:flap endonuclease-1
LGVNLTPIIVKQTIRLRDLEKRKLAVDANNALYQFLALIRTPRGIPLKAPDGTVTSHLTGLLYRTTRLVSEYQMRLTFVFDGKPSKYKGREIGKRRELRERMTKEWREALEAGDYSKAFSKAVMSSRLTRPLIQDAKTLLTLLGIPYVQALGEAEAQAAYMAREGDFWASSSRDYDSLLFGTPRLVRYLTISGREYLPSKRISRPLKPEIIVLDEFLSTHSITREQLVDLAILIGTDFNEGIKGIGPKTALKLISQHGSIDDLPDEIRARIDVHYNDVRKLFLEPKVTCEYTTSYGHVREDELYAFLCDQKGFSKARVQSAIERIKAPHERMEQHDLKRWLAGSD